MSLAEFALPTSEVKIDRTKQLRSRNDDCIEIKGLVDQIIDERKNKPKILPIHHVCDDDLTPFLKSKGRQSGIIIEHAETLEDFFKTMHEKGVSTLSISKKWRDDHDKETKTPPRVLSLKRQRPWLTPSSNSNLISIRPDTSSSCSLITPPGMDDIKIFSVDPHMKSIINNYEKTKSDDEDTTGPKTIDSRKRNLPQENNVGIFIRPSKEATMGNFSRLYGRNQRNHAKQISVMIHRNRKSGEKITESFYHHSLNNVQDLIQGIEENRRNSFQRRDERILSAKERRCNLRKQKLNILEENLRRKEEQRLDHLSTKKKEDRQSLIITTIILVSTTYGWLSKTPKIIEDYRYSKLLNDAARKIQTLWKKEMFARKAMEAVMIKSRLKPMIWRISLWFHCARRRLNAQIIRQLFLEFASNPLPYLIFEFRRKVITAQKMMKSFIECKRARIHALELCWPRLEKEVIAEITSQKRKRKNAFTDIIQKKIIGKGDGFDERNGFSNVVNDALNRTTALKEKGQVDSQLCKQLCRFYVEDSRRSHMKVTGHREVRYGPPIHLEHAVTLLAGKDLNVKSFSIARQWPTLSLFSKQRSSFKNVVKDVYRDESRCRRKVALRIEKERNMESAIRFATLPSTRRTSKDEIMFLKQFDVDEQTMKELRVIFQLIDLDCNDKLSSEEIGKLFFVLGYDYGDDYTSVASLTNDILGGDVDYKTFITTLNTCSKKDTQYNKETIIKAFQYFEKGSMGKIHGEDLFHILQSYGGKWDKEKAYKMMKNAGLSTSRYIDYRQFVSNLFSVWNCNGVSEILRL